MNIRPSDLRRMVAEWVANGCTVNIYPDGAIKVAPSTAGQKPVDADLYDWSKK